MHSRTEFLKYQINSVLVKVSPWNWCRQCIRAISYVRFQLLWNQAMHIEHQVHTIQPWPWKIENFYCHSGKKLTLFFFCFHRLSQLRWPNTRTVASNIPTQSTLEHAKIFWMIMKACQHQQQHYHHQHRHHHLYHHHDYDHHQCDHSLTFFAFHSGIADPHHQSSSVP